MINNLTFVESQNNTIIRILHVLEQHGYEVRDDKLS